MAPAAIGEQCQGGEPDCALGGLCTGATDDAPGTCVSYDDAFAGAEGDDCALLELELCGDGLVCGVESATLTGAVTKCMPKAGMGDDCVIAFPDQCPGGTVLRGPGRRVRGHLRGTPRGRRALRGEWHQRRGRHLRPEYPLRRRDLPRLRRARRGLRDGPGVRERPLSRRCVRICLELRVTPLDH